MEIIEYETPVSWDDKGMNWNTPDPTNVDYVMAIRQALLERCAALHTNADRRIYRISPAKTVSRDVAAGIVSTIQSFAGSFVNIGWEDFEEDYSACSPFSYFRKNSNSPSRISSVSIRKVRPWP